MHCEAKKAGCRVCAGFVPIALAIAYSHNVLDAQSRRGFNHLARLLACLWLPSRFLLWIAYVCRVAFAAGKLRKQASFRIVFFNWPHVRGKPKGRHSNKMTARIIAGKTEHTLYPRARLCLCVCVCVCLFAYVRLEFRRHTHVCA